MTIAEQIYELVKALPQEQASEILTFAEFIRAKHSNGDQAMGVITPELWAELVYSLAGSWGEDVPTLDGIRAELGPDILRESL